jgi:outer membrane protein W
MTIQASADGTLRRQVAQNDTQTVTTESTETVVTPELTTAPAAQAQPATVVEAAPAVESKAESLRKARQGAEVNTEQKIVEKLEESRLKEEQDRADRLFGNKLDTPAPAPAPAVVAPAPMVAPAPVVAEDKKEPAHVTIEKVEIVQPAPAVAAVKDEGDTAEGQSKAKVDDQEKPVSSNRPSVSILAGGMNYNANNVSTNYAIGLGIGTIVDEHYGIEANFLYSNHAIQDPYWGSNSPLFKELDQYNIGVAAKYYILTGKLKPYVGAGIDYVYREYQNRVRNGYWGGNNLNYDRDHQTTDAINGSLLAGVDFDLNQSWTIGVNFQYSKNLVDINKFDRASYYTYNYIPDGTRPLEEIDYTAFQVVGKYSF